MLEDPPEGLHYHFFNHFLNEAGQIVSQDDSPAIDSLYWRVGDRLVTRFYLSLPEELAGGSYALQVGLYTWPDLTRISLTDSQKNSYLVTTFELADRWAPAIQTGSLQAATNPRAILKGRFTYLFQKTTPIDRMQHGARLAYWIHDDTIE